MVGALSVVGSSVMDSHAGPCLCLDALPTSVKGGGELVLRRNSSVKRKKVKVAARSLELGSSFVDSWDDWRLSSKVISNMVNRSSRKRKQRRDRRPVIVNEVGGQYEDSFEDVKKQIQNYFTYKAVRTVLHQLYEMNPTQYMWFYNFVATNKPGDGKHFIRILGKEKQDLAERVMITRLHLYGKWVKKCDHAQMYKAISDENLELMRERLIETVIWPSDDSNTEKIG
ncbi:Chaperonin-like RbcX protein 2 [Citrus sinensis]|uniref:Chaperonin-like RbcX protein 2 n=2 Tax=Citrus sinensis TaxID=2711 RepID=A0ACB8MW28_CITSI|nr:chaperonin-like RbcX protein 2, chloroplastic [Citrus sinensis]KAH9741319.1 Chaperonin-like RbcX protein 2 [Citrus sinensis]KAH9789822.1 Chaperonin-like RbcX protein 2 [Citrus sinensis]KDO61251.1 hypothetical protein CISIN_1g027198mg [Citrus sinensis]